MGFRHTNDAMTSIDIYRIKSYKQLRILPLILQFQTFILLSFSKSLIWRYVPNIWGSSWVFHWKCFDFMEVLHMS